ncbi:hypothetical protein BJX62DRAFT_231493 [Aspergillus germanicus]
MSKHIRRSYDVDRGSFDWTTFFHRDDGPDVLPNEIIFHMLLAAALNEHDITVRDQEASIEATHAQLLSDVMACKRHLLTALPLATLEQLEAEREIPFLILAGGYEFIISFFTVLAIGGIAVPLSLKVTAKEGIHCAQSVQASAIFASQHHLSVANMIAAGSGIGATNVVVSTPFILTPVQDPSSFRIAAWRIPDQNKPALVIFTSGTTGPPKGSAMRRYTLLMSILNSITTHRPAKDATTIQLLPLHHATGLLVNTIPTVLAAGCVEFMCGGLDPARIWERFLDGKLQAFSAVPTVYVRLLRYWEDVIARLPGPRREAYRTAVSEIGSFESGTSKLPLDVLGKWRDLTGKHIAERYSGTEFGNVYKYSAGEEVVVGSVGRKNPLVHSKLSEGNRGEILVKSPSLFAKYMNDPEGTRKAFDADGYLKTGDIARQEGQYFYIEGRLSVDIIKSGGFKISALDIEQELLKHPAIAEAIVVGIEDPEYGERVAAAVVLKDPTKQMTITQLRSDLRGQLSNYKLPTLLRVVSELRKTETMKVPKKMLKTELFSGDHSEIQRWIANKDAKL